MNIIIYIKILKQNDFAFSDSDLEIIKKTFSGDIQVVDLDNHSSDSLFRLAAGYVQSAEKVCMIINASEGWGSFPLSSLLESVLKSEKPFLMISKGSHPVLEKYSAPFKEKRLNVQNLEKELDLVKTFFSPRN